MTLTAAPAAPPRRSRRFAALSVFAGLTVCGAVVGALDSKYADLARQMRARVPDARLHLLPDAGHAIHLEQPGELARILLDA